MYVSDALVGFDRSFSEKSVNVKKSYFLIEKLNLKS